MKHLPPSVKRSQRLAAARAKAIAVAQAHSNHTTLSFPETGKQRTSTNSSIANRVVSLPGMLASIMGGCGVAVALAYRSNGFMSSFSATARQVLGAEACNSTFEGTTMWNGYFIPPVSSPFGDYPNPLDITDEDRKSFHPVVMFPKKWVEEIPTEPSKPRRKQVWDVEVFDGTNLSSTLMLATDEARQERRLQKRRSKPKDSFYGIGRYDENRVGLYTTNLFQNNGDKQIDGFDGARTLHVGIDLDGPVGTKVFAFADGVIHAAGYNPDLGDYGNVIVVEHDLGERRVTLKNTTTTTTTTAEAATSTGGEGRRKIWALYGHLDDNSIKGKSVGKRIKKGQVLGRMGDFHESGGWLLPHVHFQLSIHPPETHDMPGAVAFRDRPRALIEYPDPRYILGPLY